MVTKNVNMKKYNKYMFKTGLKNIQDSDVDLLNRRLNMTETMDNQNLYNGLMAAIDHYLTTNNLNIKTEL